MNVRFFAGTKAEYLSLPVPRNPLGLYFCEDTKELFWADRLLSDGVRVVATFSDLPKISHAAEGIVYYVSETRNGYVLSSDRAKWIQIIYAPAVDVQAVPESEIYNTVTTVGAVRDIESKIYGNIAALEERIANIQVDTSGTGLKAISFAGIELVEADGVFSIDRESARRALGFIVTAGQENEEIELATRSYVDEQIALIPEADLSDYATKDAVISAEDKIDKVDKSTHKIKYEVLPIDGMLVLYNDNEIRINTQYVDIDSLPKQDTNDNSSDEYYYVTFRAYAPENATSVVEGQNDKMDAEHSELAIDSYGRKYVTIWAAIAIKNNSTWSKFGDSSTIDKYLGFYFNFHWYKDNMLIGMDRVRVILTNDSCHNDLVPDAVARRIDDKTTALDSALADITEQVQNIESSYVTNDFIQQQNFVTNQYIEQNYITTEQLEATYVTSSDLNEKVENTVTEVIQEKVDAGEIAVKVDAINYDTF